MTIRLKNTLSDIQRAAKLLREEKLVAFPTETVYGLGAPIFSPSAIQKIFQVKQRPADNPLIAHISSIAQIPLLAQEVTFQLYSLMEAFFPGPLTIIFAKSEKVPPIATGGLSTIGIRMPDHPIALSLIEAVGIPIVAPSANLSGRPSPTCAQHVLDDLQDKIGAVIEGGECRYGLESTVLLLNPQPTILRPGAITRDSSPKKIILI